MAEEKAEAKAEAKAQEKPAEAPAENKETKDKAEKGKGRSIVPIAIVAVIVLVAAGAGVGLSRLFAGGGGQKPAEEAATEKEASAEKEPSKHAEKSEGKEKEGEKSKGEKSKSESAAIKGEDGWYFNLDPVVANLDEPGATRYVRAAFTLEMPAELSIEKGTAFLEQKKPLITNLLTIYLAGLNIDSIRGDKNLKRIQSDLCDLFNERLYPNSKPMIKRILIKEFAVQ
jgi:flagellar basal body-associated protein FliL